MKRLHTLIIPLLFTQLIYAESKNITVPKNIQTKLCQKFLKESCTPRKALAFNNTFKLNNNKFLLFSHIEKSDSLYSHGYKNIPLIVDEKNNWQIINHHIEAEIQNVLRDPHGGIWIHSLWMIEGVSPLLYYSKDGDKWQQITLPRDENNYGIFEDLEICFQQDSLQLRFNNLDNTEETKIWESTYQLSLDKKPLWNKVTKKTTKKNCSKASKINNRWILSKDTHNKSTFTITNTDTIHKPIISNKQPIHFSLQLGTFKEKSSINKLYTQMENIENTIIQRKFIVEGKTLYKAFIGDFTSHNNAKETLSILRKKHPNNSILKNAFITKLK